MVAADHGAIQHGRLKGVLWTKKQLDALKTEEKDNRRLPWGDKLRDLLSTSAFISPGNTKDTINAVF